MVEVAQRAGCSASILGEYERAERAPRDEQFVRDLAVVLGVQADDLVVDWGHALTPDSPPNRQEASSPARDSGRRSRMGRRFGFASAIVVVVVTAVLALDGSNGVVPIQNEPSVPAVAPITVAPNSGLKNIDLVTVSSTGYGLRVPAEKVAIVECTASHSEAPRCDFGSERFARVNQPGGGFRTPFTVHEKFQGSATPNGPTSPVDCTVAPGCLLSVGQSNPNVSAVQLISFGTGASVSMMVTRSTGLTDDQSVTVTGTGYDPTVNHGNVSIIECASEPAETCDDATAGSARVQPDGSFSTSFTVHQTFQFDPTGANTLIDCTVAPGCSISAAQSSTIFAAQSITFD